MPGDVGVFSPFKQALKQSFDEARRTNPSLTLNQVFIIFLLSLC
jgi:hypothetical protein